MALHLEHGPFHHFEGEWKLAPLAADGLQDRIPAALRFQARITGKLAAPVFDRIANTLVDAFVARADSVYAGSSRLRRAQCRRQRPPLTRANEAPRPP